MGMKDLILLGGGHSHIEVLRSFGLHRHNRLPRSAPHQQQSLRQRHPEQPATTQYLQHAIEAPRGSSSPRSGAKNDINGNDNWDVEGGDAVRLTVVSRGGRYTPYSGMLPGWASGFYSYRDCHIDLQLLADYSGARLVAAEATGLDLGARQVIFSDGRPPLSYDVLSIDIGITPGGMGSVPGAAKHATPVKPIDGRNGGRCTTLPQVGDLIRRDGDIRTAATAAAGCNLLCRGGLLPGHPPHVRKLVGRLLAERGVQVATGADVVGVAPGELLLRGGGRVPYDECLWCTAASPAEWLRGTGLPTDAQGFLAINDYLQSDGGPPEVFAAGDVATSTTHPRPKAGVFAVRQGPPLAANLRAFLGLGPAQPQPQQQQQQPSPQPPQQQSQQEPSSQQLSPQLPPPPPPAQQQLKRFVPQKTAMALISMGDRFCVISRTGHHQPNTAPSPPTAAAGGTSTTSPTATTAPTAAAATGTYGDAGPEWRLGWLLNGFGGALIGLTGPLLWRWKDSIDRTFMRRYGEDLRKAAGEQRQEAAKQGA